jgi:hypothetical protein
MNNGRLELQKDIYGALTGDATLMAKITGVYDFVPDNTAYPFIQIGEVDFSDWGTQTFDGFEGVITINLWHRPGSRGRAPLHDIMHDIHRILHKNTFSIPGFTVALMRYDFSNIIVDPDAVTYHGVTRFRILMGEI